MLVHWRYCSIALCHRYASKSWAIIAIGPDNHSYHLSPFWHQSIIWTNEDLLTHWGRVMHTWVRSRNCGCLVTWFCYQLIAKPGNKTATVSWPSWPICISKLTIIGSDNGLLPGWHQANDYLNQWWNIINLTLSNKCQWNINCISYIFIQENAFENVIYEMAAKLSRP